MEIVFPLLTVSLKIISDASNDIDTWSRRIKRGGFTPATPIVLGTKNDIDKL